MANTLVVYYSRKGENHTPNGIQVLEKGNTEYAAEYIAKALNADIFEVDTVKPYAENYRACCGEVIAEAKSLMYVILPLYFLCGAMGIFAGFLRGIAAKYFDPVAFFKRILDKREAPSGICCAAEHALRPADHILCEFTQPIFFKNDRYVCDSIRLIRVYTVKMQADGFRRPDGRFIGVLAI